MSSKELTVSSLGDAVRDKVRLAMFESIPDEAMDKVIAGEFEKFFSEKERIWLGGKNVEVSPLQKMIKEEIQQQLQVRLKATIQEFLDSKKKDQSQPDFLDQGIKKYCAEIAPLMMKEFFANMAGQAVQQMTNNLNSQGHY